MSFRPTFWPTVFTIPMVLVLLGLGTWQLHRLEWKEALIAERSERTTAPPTALPAEAIRSAADLAALQYRHAVVTGAFLNDREMYLAARTLDGKPGYHVVTPFRLTEPALGARYLLINRGWVPIDRKDPATRRGGLAEGRVTLDGLVRLPSEPGLFTPDNEPAENTWYWIDLPAMAAHAGIAGEVAPVYLDAGPGGRPGTYPVGGQTRLRLPNNHLQYAITWYSLAVVLVVIYVIYHRREPERGSS